VKHIRLLLAILLYGLCGAELLFPDVLLKDSLIYLISLLMILRLSVRGYSDSLTLVISIATIFLFALPASAIYHYMGMKVVPAVFGFLVFSDLMLYISCTTEKFNRTRSEPIFTEATKIDVLVFAALLIWCSVAGIFIDASGFAGLFVFLAPFSISLVYLDRLVSGRQSKYFYFFVAVGYAFVVGMYAMYQWSGFGRLVVGGYILAPILIINSRVDLGFRLIYVVAAAPVALYIAQLSRYGAIESESEIFIGSAGHHLIVSHDVMQRNDHQYYGGFDVFFSQYLLYFYNWVPRDYWPDKPIGVGSWSVDVVYTRRGFDEGYSQSIGFLGEQYFYLGNLFWIGLFIVFISLYATRVAVSRLSFGFVAPVVLFDVNLISFFWGGCATFGSRFWFMGVPAILACWLLHRRSCEANIKSGFPRSIRRRQHV
jgi:hypothetical protein